MRHLLTAVTSGGRAQRTLTASPRMKRRTAGLGGALGIALSLAVGAAHAQPVPNLRVVAVEAPPEATRGSTLRLRLSLESLGAAARVEYAVLAAVSRIRTGALELGRFGPVDLSADALVALEVDVRLPDRVEGVRALLVEVDPAGVVAESNENDNVGFAAAETLIRAPDVDPGVRDVTLSPTRRAPGEPFSVGFVLENLGSASAGVPLRVVLSRDPVATIADREVARQTVALPSGVTLTERVDLVVPLDLSAGPWHVGVLVDPEGSVSVPDPGRSWAVAPETLRVTEASLSLVTRTLPDAVAGRPYALRLEARGGDGEHRFELRGTLPTGLTFDGETATLAGIPGEIGLFSLEAEVRSAGLSDSERLSLFVQATGLDLAIATATLAEGFVGRPYEQPLFAGGGAPPYVWRLAGGSLPLGLTLEADGRIEGTPETLAVAELELEVEDAALDVRRGAFLLIVSLAPELRVLTSSVSSPVGVPLDHPLEAIGGLPPLSWAATTPPPPGLRVEGGRLTGTPSRVGRFPFQVEVNDASTPAVRDVARVEVVILDDGALRLTSGPMPVFERGALVEHALTAEGGTPPYRYFPVPGRSLPPDLAIARGPSDPERTAVLSGRPSSPGLWGFTVGVEDAEGRTDTKPLALVVEAPLSAASDGCRCALGSADASPSRGVFFLLAGLLLVGVGVASLAMGGRGRRPPGGLRGLFRPRRHPQG